MAQSASLTSVRHSPSVAPQLEMLGSTQLQFQVLSQSPFTSRSSVSPQLCDMHFAIVYVCALFGGVIPIIGGCATMMSRTSVLLSLVTVM